MNYTGEDLTPWFGGKLYKPARRCCGLPDLQGRSNANAAYRSGRGRDDRRGE